MFGNYFLVILNNLLRKLQSIPKKIFLLIPFLFGLLFIIFSIDCSKKIDDEYTQHQIQEAIIENNIENIQEEKKEIKNNIRRIKNKKADTDISIDELDKFYDDILKK